MWKTINADNAIEVMALAIVLAEPMNAVLFRRLTRDLESLTLRAGLTDRSPVQGIELTVGPTNEVNQVATNGIMFDKTSLIRDQDDVIARHLVEQLQWTTGSIVYRAWKYPGWTSLKAKALGLMAPPLAEIVKSVAIKSARIEYRDRFYFEGDPADAVVSDVIQADNIYVSPHIFSLSDLWHSHTGKFDALPMGGKKLSAINVDCGDIIPPSPLVGKRTIGIVSAVEHQYDGEGLVVDQDPETYLQVVADQLHSDAVNLFRVVVDQRLLAQMGLL